MAVVVAVIPNVASWATGQIDNVLSVDRRTAVVTTLFDYPGQPIEGKRTQVWTW